MATTVLTAFEQMLADLRLSDNQKAIAQGRISHLQAFFTAYALDKAPWPIGSYNRETLIRWERDVDVMVALSLSAYAARYKDDSAAFLTWIRNGLNDGYKNTKVSTRGISVRIFLGEAIEVDLVPSFTRTGGGYLIPNGTGGWRATNPPFHHDLVQRENVRLDRLKRLIRLMKAWNNANGHPLRSFHVEMMVVAAWCRSSSIPAWPTGVAQSLASLASQVTTRFFDPSTPPVQSIDDDLGATERAAAQKMLRDDAGTAGLALQSDMAGRPREAFEQWGLVFRHKFPTYG